MNPLSSALTAMRRSPYQTLAAILMVSLTCFVGYTFSLALIGAEKILQYFETRPQIIGFFDLNASSEQIDSLKQTMQQKPYVDTVTVVSKDQALELYKQDNQDDPLLLELVSADILPASIEVSGKDAQSLGQIKDDLSKAQGVEEVVFQQDVLDTLTTWTKSLRYVGAGLIALLGITSFLLITVIIGMKITTKKSAIHIMRIIGATKWYIQAPFMFEGVLYGVVGSVLGWTVTYAGLLYLTPWLKDFLGSVPLLPVPWEFLAMQLGLGTLIALVIGSFASLTAARRMIRK
jgi:cell division transport system permease protein